jgi:uncharacterized membrane protein HdeD (DUF308 family)
MGMFWLLAGIVGVRQEAHREGNRLLLIAALVGVVTGLLVIARGITRNYLPETLMFDLLGWVILLTGVLHITTGFRIIGSQHRLSEPTVVSTLLGVIEIVLGVLFLIMPTGRNQAVYVVGTIWALLGGALLLGTALLHWGQARRQEQEGGSQPEPQDGKPDGPPAG